MIEKVESGNDNMDLQVATIDMSGSEFNEESQESRPHLVEVRPPVDHKKERLHYSFSMLIVCVYFTLEYELFQSEICMRN